VHAAVGLRGIELGLALADIVLHLVGGLDSSARSLVPQGATHPGVHVEEDALDLGGGVLVQRKVAI
jgi:hypothetical protein